MADMWIVSSSSCSCGMTDLEALGVVLQPVTTAEYPDLYDMEVGSSLGPVWRFGSQAVSPDDFLRRFWQGLHEAWVVRTAPGSKVRGLVFSYGLDPCARVVWLGVVADVSPGSSSVAMRGLGAFIDRLFTTWDLALVLGECSDAGLELFGRGLRLFAEDVVHLERPRAASSPWVVALTPESWAAVGHRRLARWHAATTR